MDDVMFSSSSDEWATPQPLFDQINEVFGPFNLDPCGNAQNHKAERVFGPDARYPKDRDGLAAKWAVYGRAANVFVNPPFSREKKMPIEPWIEKAWHEIRIGNASQVVMLIPARTETRIWHHVIFPHAKVIAFVKGRIQFDGVTKSGKPASATFPSAIVVFTRAPAGGDPRFRGQTITTWEQRR